MKNGCKSRCCLVAHNHVWRYTLRLFHIFVIFEKNKKSMHKCVSEVVVFDPKIDLGRTMRDRLYHVGSFLVVPMVLNGAPVPVKAATRTLNRIRGSIVRFETPECIQDQWQWFFMARHCWSKPLPKRSAGYRVSDIS